MGEYLNLVPKPAPTIVPKPAPTIVPKPAPTIVPKPAPTIVPKPAPTIVPEHYFFSLIELGLENFNCWMLFKY